MTLIIRYNGGQEIIRVESVTVIGSSQFLSDVMLFTTTLDGRPAERRVLADMASWTVIDRNLFVDAGFGDARR